MTEIIGSSEVYIRIKKCDISSHWYNEHIGKIFRAEEVLISTSGFEYYVHLNNSDKKVSWGCIGKDCADVIEINWIDKFLIWLCGNKGI